MKDKGIELIMKNDHIEAFELEINSLKATLKSKETKCKYLEEENKKLPEDLKILQDANLKIAIENFDKAKAKFEEKLKIKD